MNRLVADLRKDYTLNALDSQDVLASPFAQFGVWFEEALVSGILEPNAMILSTITTHQRPNARVVLLKGFDETGFVFYTNYESQKAADIAAHSVAALTFWWDKLERQVRIEGTIKKVSEAESNAYFAVRPRGSQIGAWVSAQSSVIANRDLLYQKQAELEAQFEGQTIERPPHWGGYRVEPDSIEFWQGQSSRLHDRLRYRLDAQNNWLIERLSP